jgi:hypothetical protein
MSERYVHRNRCRRPCPAGDRRQPVFKRVSDAHGEHLEKVGETDVQDLIDSYADEVDINRIIRRYTAGDTSVLNRMQSMYFDATGAPHSLTEAFETVSAARSYFESLPQAVKREFNGLGGFLSAIRTLNEPDTKPSRKVDTDHE